MSTFGRRHAAAPPAQGRRSARTQFAEWSERFARTAPDEEYLPAPDEHAVFPRFPMARQGYDRSVVDEHVADLERELIELDRELVELRARATSNRRIEAEIQRIGEQTSSILLEAHDKAQETTRIAQEEADRCVADAAANAVAITEDANRQLRQLEGELTALTVKRQRLLEDVRGIAGSLSSIAEDAGEQFQPAPTPVAAGQPSEPLEVYDREAADSDPADPMPDSMSDADPAADSDDPEHTIEFEIETGETER
jgi:cell division septum initiation protein DivIVA